MGLKKELKISVPEFDIPEIYKADKWTIKEWDYYKNSSDLGKTYWDKRSSVTEGVLDFTLCDNICIREELKFCMYQIMQQGIKLNNFAMNYDYFKTLCGWLNSKMEINSLIDCADKVPEYEKYFQLVLKRPSIVSSGTRINIDMEKVTVKRKNKTITFLTRCIDFVRQYLDRNLTLMERDEWTPKYLISQHYDVKNGKRLDFSDIPQENIKYQAKIFCKHKIEVLDIKYHSICGYLRTIRLFSIWLYEYDSSIKYLDELNREIIEDYFLYLRTESDYSSYNININILNLKKIFETLLLLDSEHVPQKPLILAQDYSFKPKKESNYFTQEEAQNITNVIKFMNKTDAAIIMCLKVLGLRIDELLSLTPSNIKKEENDNYYLDIYQTKNKKEYRKPLVAQMHMILNAEIEKNRKKFGCEPNYVFCNDSNNKMDYSAFCKRINKIFYEHKVLDRTGNILRFQTHRFRATYATNLINAGYGAEQTSQMLGHKSLESLTHYIKIHDETVIKQLAPRISRDQLLISNIYSMEKIGKQKVEIGTPLCNGWCVRDIETFGVCEKANSCLKCSMFKPSPEFLYNYCMQLEDVLAVIEVAKANNMEALLNKNLQLKERLEEIINAVREMLK